MKHFGLTKAEICCWRLCWRAKRRLRNYLAEGNRCQARVPFLVKLKTVCAAADVSENLEWVSTSGSARRSITVVTRKHVLMSVRVCFVRMCVCWEQLQGSMTRQKEPKTRVSFSFLLVCLIYSIIYIYIYIICQVAVALVINTRGCD